MISNIVNEVMLYILIAGLATLIVSCANILGITAEKEKDRPKPYFVLVWCMFVLSGITLILGVHSEQIAFALSPLILALCSTTLYLSKQWFNIQTQEISMATLRLQVKQHQEIIKMLLCVLIFFFARSIMRHTGLSKSKEVSSSYANSVAPKKNYSLTSESR